MKNILTPLNEKAAAYVSTNPDEGYAQFQALKLIGMLPKHKVLEIGCGVLNAGIPVIDYLDKGNYAGIEPNEWLIQETLQVPQNKELCQAKAATLLFNESFDATETDMKFDFIFGHSVMSHAAYWQLELFLRNSAAALAPGGKLLFSFHLAGKPGCETETMDDKWHYPGSVWIEKEKFEALAGRFFNFVEYRPDIQKILMSYQPSAFHDWVLMQNI